MAQHHIDIAIHLGAAWTAGSLIGLERSFHGRPAGFRTHALVCLSSGLLMLVTAYQWDWLGKVPLDTVRTDPTRIAQGIMTGIGFLGAGVIFKEGLTVRGLTTAASIWMTAAIGILFGVGFFYPAALATLATLGTLAIFRRIEGWLPSQSFGQLVLRFAENGVPPESEVRQLIAKESFSIANMAYRLDREAGFFEYRMTIRTQSGKALEKLADILRARTDILEFRISPSGD
ncbi:MgtC/SapB family protein [Hyphomicrobium sp.]|uniref:MgtC/SapB family protein n=1 Tax=Hyphomicrobium sp. TaxID=82 RepID=UPI002BD3EF54|nr:MgtC/SapB family protein [Hyphomicrobium sp.]HRN83854.1 MgtC/SapB family protein [Hyphomicrobium sp.]HRN88304.1 MgtC/SapB family protein [Hyphomicrobium sp.]HRQ26545.1 MgtC/SapB family protein [Hyphomicrobium sp.]